MAIWHSLIQSCNPKIQVNSQISPDKCVMVTAWSRIYLPIHSIWMKSTTLHMHQQDVGTFPCGFDEASTTAIWHRLMLSSFHMMHQEDVGSFPCGYKASKTVIWHILTQSGNPNDLTSLTWQMCDGVSMMEDFPSNPQHMNEVHFFSYASRSCGILSMWVWSFNNGYLT